MSFSEWKTFKLGQICSKIGSGATPKGGKESYSESGEYSLIRSQNVLDYVFSYDGLAYINQEQASKLNNVTIEEEDVLLNITGDSVARVCQVPKNVLPARVNQHVSIIRPNRELLDNGFLKYYLLNPTIKALLLNYSSVGATRNAITKGMIEELDVTIPSIEQQKQIAHILSRIDGKIENNLATNQTLEEIARTLFKEWFVNFNYPGANGQMNASEEGDIPEGWEVGTLGDVINNFDSKRIPLSSRERDNRKGTYSYYGAASIIDYVDGYIFDGVYLLMGEDGTVITADEKPVLQYVNGKFWVNNHTHVLQGKDYFTTEFLYLLLRDRNVKHLVTGAVQPKINQGNMNALTIVKPARELVEKFGVLVKPFFEKMLDNLAENETLKNTRDSLLPKLMSGEIELNG